MTMQDATPWAVMILAHNEEDKIVACLDSLFAGELGKPFDVYVMANGCTDRTETLVADYAARQPAVHLVSISMGDKCNAWNVFVNETAKDACPGREIYFFMDGDARIAPGSLSVMASALQHDTHAHAAAAVPGSGRSMRHDADEILSQRGLVANLYALRGAFMQRLQALGVRIPLKLEGDDGLIGALVKWDLDTCGEWDHQLIHPCAEAKFLFDPVPMASLAEWPKYWKRLVRYGRRHYEFQLLGPVLKAGGLAAMPRDIRDIYGGAEKLSLPWRGLQTPTFAIALSQMRQIASERDATCHARK
jgi:glycosyltransferase involved in cell wall biosynthesis